MIRRAPYYLLLSTASVVAIVVLYNFAVNIATLLHTFAVGMICLPTRNASSR